MERRKEITSREVQFKAFEKTFDAHLKKVREYEKCVPLWQTDGDGLPIL